VQPIRIAQMIEVDRLMVDEYGITLQQMMENAGRSLAGLARRLLGGSAAGRKVAVMVGKGNNGGGGLVAARHLANAGADIQVMIATPPDELGTVPERQRRILARMGVPGSHRTTAATELPALFEETESSSTRSSATVCAVTPVSRSQALFERRMRPRRGDWRSIFHPGLRVIVAGHWNPVSRPTSR